MVTNGTRNCLPPWTRLGLGLALLASACSSPAPSAATGDPLLVGAAPGQPGWETPAQGPDDEVVARVQGVAIHLSDLQAAVDAEPPGARPEVILQRAIDFELLAQRAAARGYGHAAEVTTAGQQAAVRVLLAEDFERATEPEDLPSEVLSEAYERNRWLFNNPALVHVAHVRLPVPKGAPEETWLQVGADAAALHAELAASPILGLEDFLERARRLGERFGEPDVGTIGRVALNGKYVAEFAQAAHALLRDGDLSQPVRTQFGWHILYRYGYTPARSQPLAEVEPQVREKVWPEWRKYRFFRYLEELHGKARVEVYAERLLWPPPWARAAGAAPPVDGAAAPQP